MLALFNQIAPDVDPIAKGVYERMRATYAKLQSFECVCVDSPGSQSARRARLSYCRPGTILIQRLDEGGRIDRECRFYDGEVVQSSPLNTHRYVRERLEPKRPAWFAAMNGAGAASACGELGALLGEYPSTSNITRFVRMRLGVRTRAADGTPVDVLTVERETDIPTSPVRWGYRGTAFYQIGVDDGLVRRIDRQGGLVDDRIDRQSFGFEDVHADRGIPDRAFAFHAPEGATAVKPWRWDERHDPAAEAVVAQMRSTLAGLRSLSFVVARTDDSMDSVDAEGKRTPLVSRAVVRFDLQRPLQARGEARIVREGSGRRAWVVSDGAHLFWGPDWPWGVAGVPLRNPSKIASFGQDGMPYEAGWLASEIVERFFEPTGQKEFRFGGYRLEKPVTIRGEIYDVLVHKSLGVDRYGIPSDEVILERYWVGRKDHLIHGCGKGSSPCEWLIEVIPDAPIPAERFAPPAARS